MPSYETRDRSGPMDIDQQDPMERLAQFAISEPNEGPSRKRPHTDMSSSARPFAPSSSHKLMHFGQNTPFIFNLPAHLSSPAPPAQFRPYNPSEWTGSTFGFETDQAGPSSSRHGGRNYEISGRAAEDIEMRWGDSPAKTALPDETAPAEKQMHKDTASGEKNEESEQMRPMATGAINRVRKRRQKDWKRRTRDSESEGEDTRALRKNNLPPEPTKSEHTYHFNMNPQAMRHSEIPSLLLGYLQFFVNAAVVVFVLYLAVQFVQTVQRDVRDRMSEASVEILQEIAECSNLYLTNRCDPATRVPAMDAACRAWDACMHRDPTLVGRTNVMAETFAGVINSFVDPISWKTMGFTLVTLSFLIILTNSALFNLRSKVAPEPTYQTPPAGMYPPHLLHAGQYPSNAQAGWGLPDTGHVQAISQPHNIGWHERKKGWLW